MSFDSPIITFTVLLAVIFTIPPIFERLKLPGLVGLLLAGVILGPNALKLLNPETDTIKLLSDIGKVYLMFVAGLEIDLAQFRQTRNRSIGFGSLTFLVPMIAGILVGRMFNFGWNASVLIGSLLASHTLLAYPIVSRLGVVTNEAVTVTIGATIFTDTGALLVLAVCAGIHGGDFTAGKLVTLLVGLALYSLVILVGFDRAGKEFFRRSGDEQSNQFLFILLALFLASVGAQVIGVEKIVGAFLAGLAVNDVLGRSPVKEKVEFVGSVLFIPCFFVDMGLLINIPAFIKTLSSIALTLAIVVALIGSKFLAAFFAKLLYRYNRDELLTMWSLSLPQVAATLAAALVAYETVNPAGERLIGEEVLNSVIVLMLVTSIAGPMITARFAPRLPLPKADESDDRSFTVWQEADDHPFTVVVPIYNPNSQRYLIEMAALLASHEGGRIVPLSVAIAHVHMDDPNLITALADCDRRLREAVAISESFGVKTTPIARIDDQVALAISRASREQNASLVVMGWGDPWRIRARVFGSIIDSVFWSSHCPVAVTRLLSSPIEFRSILVPAGNLSESTLAAIQFARILAGDRASVVILHVHDRYVSPQKLDVFKFQLSRFLAKSSLPANASIRVVADDNVSGAIVHEAKNHDLTVLRSVRYRTAGGLGVSEVTTRVLKGLTGSIVLLGEPRRY
ncbi:cation:proton antiporter [Pannus brasiliensis CCIBt3594]|uniref:Cation:proton antiporter n=1 Tax=Pannus brasiliensis CCIBt3594 TaxID=1427578 RepID=A0AAW9QQZ6_9CHRO